MARHLASETRQQAAFSGPEEEAFLDLQRTASLLSQAVGRELKPHRLTPAQYNTLRILRSAAPAALTCGEIGDRLVGSGPDVTRLLDRLEAQGLVERLRDAGDRRIVRTRITGRGAALAGRIEAPLATALRRLLGPLGRSRLRVLIELLQQARRQA
ncbi:MAG TPA: MarR family transcriptional regulator [Thermoanaerobaculia bacterium]|jgi:DNA-binding MarR family transcriptional regulator|nr:MarR family transcriptional regulator [Thermoanaerobaculia bacterium]